MVASLDLPPLYRAIVLREVGDAFAHACDVAGAEGAGTLVWARRYDAVEMAFVFEPDEPLMGARRAIYAVMNAAGDAVATHCPPERSLGFTWPDTILLGGAVVGGVRLAWPRDASEQLPPAWLVASVVLRLALPSIEHVASGPGFDPEAKRGTSLELGGIEMLDAATLVGSIARHLMVQIDRWQVDGFGGVAKDYLSRLAPEPRVRYGIDGNGDLVARRLATSVKTQRQALLEALKAPQWRDPETGEPWL